MRHGVRELLRLLRPVPGFLVLGASCGPPAGPPTLEVLSWPGQDGRLLALDQPLEIEFDAPLDSGLRLGAFALLPEDEPTPAVFQSFEIAGRYLVLWPRLPLRADLSDGTLRPDTEYRLLLRGLPHLVAIHARDGAVLVGVRRIQFHTLPASDPAALQGDGGSDAFLRVRPRSGGVRARLEVGRDGVLVIPFDGALDPRSVRSARLLRPSGDSLETPLRLVKNLPEEAWVRVRVPDPGWSLLLLPEGLEGIGGRPLLAADRRLRLFTAE